MLWLLLATALGHPGADGHHADDCRDVPAILRYAQALVTDGRFEEAQAAVATAAACGADPAETDLAAGSAWLAAGEAERALPLLDAAARRQPGPPTLIARAEALEAVGRHADAAEDRLAALAIVSAAAPDLWLAAARSLSAAGRPDEALAVIDRGIEATGPVAALVRAGVALSEPEAALRRLDAVPATPAWLELRAEVLLRAGRAEEARDTLEQALAAARSARPSRRATEQVEALQAALARLEAP